jgi:hypothetical protein
MKKVISIAILALGRVFSSSQAHADCLVTPPTNCTAGDHCCAGTANVYYATNNIETSCVPPNPSDPSTYTATNCPVGHYSISLYGQNKSLLRKVYCYLVPKSAYVSNPGNRFANCNNTSFGGPWSLPQPPAP